MMRAHIVKIGNSQGIRIPKPILEQLGIEGTLILKSKIGRSSSGPLNPRSGWNEAFREMAKNGDELPVDEAMELLGPPLG